MQSGKCNFKVLQEAIIFGCRGEHEILLDLCLYRNQIWKIGPKPQSQRENQVRSLHEVKFTHKRGQLSEKMAIKH